MLDAQLPAWFEASSRRFAGCEALRGRRGSLDYEQLQRRVAAYAGRLMQARPAVDAMVFMLATDLLELAPALLACLRQARVFVPLDPEFPEQRLRDMLALAPSGLLMTAPEHQALARSLAEGRTLVLLEDGVEAPPPADATGSDGELPAYVYFSSGSTGRPKPILGRLGALTHYFRVLPAQLQLERPPRVAQLAAPTFDAFLRELFLALLHGGCLVQPPRRSLLGDGAQLGHWLHEQGIDLLSCVPTLFRHLVRGSAHPLPERVLLAGEALTVEDLAQWRRLRPPTGRLFNLYGPTETTLTRLVQPIDGETAPERIAVGLPLEGTNAWIADRQGRPSADGQPGEIMLDAGLASYGYYGRPAQTAASFVPCPVSTVPGARAYRSGDLGFRERAFYLSGRLDRQVKHNGVRIHLEEIEAALRQGPGVRDAAAVLQQERAGTRLIAYVVGDRDEGLRAAMVDGLPSTHLPTHYIWLEKLPQLANGKLDRAALPRFSAPESAPQPPRNAMETLVLAEFNQVLGQVSEDVKADFFQRGGHSLLALRLLERLHEASGKRVALHAFFKHPSPAELALYLEDLPVSAAESKSGPEPGDWVPQSAAQRRIMFVHELEGRSSTYNLVKCWELAERLAAGALEQVWQALVERQWSLRTRFFERDARLLQAIEPSLRFELATLDLSQLGQDGAERRARALLADAAARPFQLDRPPLFRLWCMRLEARRWVVGLVIHHIAADAWSLRLLESQLFAGYAQLIGGGQLALSAPPLQMVQLCRTAPLADEALSAAIAARAQVLRGVPFGQPLGQERARHVATALRAESLFRQLPTQRLAALQDLAKALGATPFSLVMSAFAVALLRRARRPGMLLAVPWFNRERSETHELVGMLVETLVVPLSVQVDDTPVSLVRRHRAALIEALGATQVPLEALVAHFNPGKRSGANPLTPCSFNYIDLPRPSVPKELPLSAWNVRPESRARFELALVARAREDGLLFELRYARELFDGETMASLLAEVEAELARFLEYPHQPLALALIQADPADPALALPVRPGFRAPQEPTAQRLAELWQDLLRCGPVGADDEFFALGGHSMLALRLLAEVEQVFGVSLALRQLFLNPSLTAMAALLAQSRPVVASETAVACDRLSSGQRRLWSLARLHGNVSAYHLTLGFRLDLAPRAQLLWHCFRLLLERHQELRAYFPAQQGEPRRMLRESAAMPFELLDGRGLAEAALVPLQQLLRERLAREPFSLAHGPLLRVRVLMLSERAFVVFAVFHHLVADAFSKRIFRQEFGQIYGALSRGTRPRLADAGPSYASFAQRQQRPLEHSLAFFRQRLANADGELGIVADLQADARPSFSGGRVRFAFEPALAARMDERARAAGATPFQLGLALFGLFLLRYAGREDLCIGLPITQREGRAWRRTIGFFANTVVLRFRADWARCLDELLAALRAELFELLEHAALPYEDLSQALARERGSSQPLFRLMFNFRERERVAGGSRHEPMEQQTAKFDLLLNLVHRPGSYRGSLIYSDERYSGQLAQQLVESFLAFAADVLAQPGADLRRLAVHDGATRARLLAAAQAPRLSQSGTLHGLFEAQARQTPQAVALLTETAALSYAALDEAADFLATTLRRHGLGPERLAVIAMSNRPERLVALLAVLKSGAAFAPLDAQLPPAALERQLAELQANLVLTEAALVHNFRVEVPVLTPAAAAQVRLPACEVPAQAAAYVMSTSGSTGRGKAVVVEHGQSLPLMSWSREAMAPGEFTRVLAATRLGFDVALFEIFATLSQGGALVLAEDLASPPPRLAPELTMVCASPSAARMILSWPELAERRLTINLAGEAPSAQLLRQLARRRDVVRVRNLYGPTEFAIYATACDPAEPEASSAIGRAIAGRAAQVLDANLEPCPDKVVGNLFLGGDGCARGYLGQPALTAAQFVPDPFSDRPGQRLYRTGDRVHRRGDGSLVYHGRGDRQVKLRGMRIELGAVEAVLRGCAQVAEAVVELRQDRDVARLVAWLVPSGGEDALARVRAYAEAHLAAHLVPVEWQLLERLPLLPSGKLDRGALTAKGEPVASYAPPEGAIETLLAQAWREVLAVERVGRHDAFHQLGGDSISAILVAAAARNRGLSFHPRDLLLAPTIAALASRTTRLRPESPALPAPTGPIPLAPMQHWYFQLVGACRDFFTQVRVLEPNQVLELGALRQALKTLCARHEVLRLQFEIRDGRWQQTPGTAQDSFNLVELAVTDEQATAWLRRQIALQQARLTPEAPAKLAAMLVRRPRGGDYLVLIAHHLVIDGISWRILVEDLIECYDHCAWGETPAGALGDSGFRLWSEHLAERARGRLEPAEQAWLDELRGAQFRLPAALLAEGPGCRAEELVRRGSWAAFGDLSAELIRRHRLSPEAFLLAGLVEALARPCQGRDLVVFLERHGRHQPGLSLARSIGWFTNLFPVRFDGQVEGPGAFMREVKRALRRVPKDGQAYGIERYLRAVPGIDVPALVLFNFMGGLDRARQPAWRRVELAVQSRGEGVPRGFALEFNARVVDGCLRLRCAFPPGSSPAAAQALLDDWLTALGRNAELLRAQPAAALETGDFPAAELSAAALATLRQQPPFDQPEQLEQLACLSAFQQGQLFHGLLDRAGEYRLQRAYSLPSGTQPAFWRQAWSQLIARHGALRTRFIWQQGQPLQWVARDVQVNWLTCDWRELSAAEQQQRWDELLEQQRAQAFAFDLEPPYRLCLVRLGEDCYRQLLTIHHILVDGWSLALIWREVQRLYEALVSAQPARLAAAPSFIDWLEARRREPAELAAFWRAELDGVAPLRLAATQVGPRFSIERRLTAVQGEALNSWAVQRGLTLFPLFQGAWALTLAGLGACGEVVFGTTLSGRALALEGVERVVGACCQTVPVRIRLEPETPLALWLELLEERGAALEAHGEVAMADLHRWAGVAAGARLFDCLLVYENFPRGKRRQGQRPELLFSHDRADYPVTLLIHGRQRPRFRLVVEQGALQADQAAVLLDQFVDLLTRFPACSFHALSELVPVAEEPMFRPVPVRREAPVPMLANRPPETALQRELAALWSSVLDQPVDDVQASFFDLGGNSLLLIRLFGQLQQRYGQAVVFADLFARPSIAALAETLERRQDHQAADAGRKRADLRLSLRKRQLAKP